MVAEVFGGVSALKAALDILKTVKDANDVATRQGIVIKLQEQILSAQAAQFELIEQIGSLKEKVASLEKWETEKQNYELKTLGWNTFAYMLKPEARGSHQRIGFVQNATPTGMQKSSNRRDGRLLRAVEA